MKTVALLILSILLSSCAFRAPMVASPTGDGKYWVLKEPLIYDHPQTKRTIEVPEGFVTDLASVPRLFWVAFPPCGQYTPAAVVHDYLYWEQPSWCDREAADQILLTAMKESNVNYRTRTAIYRSVRAGGNSSWKKNAKLKNSGVIRHVPAPYMNFGPNDTWSQIEARIRAGSR